ncbi:MAG TPA: ribokinase [Chloroflexia bacterium]|nr:ribokinase [Chloroflexia bacterium]
MSVVVFGSINMDLVVQANRLPKAGETVTGRTFFETPGGKGANQAVAAARLKVPTAMTGQVGDDRLGHYLLEHLRKEGVEVSGIGLAPGTPTGVAVITLDETAQNRIIVVPGANGAIGAACLGQFSLILKPGSVLLLQLEIPLAAVEAAIELAEERNALVILDPAPVPAEGLPASLYHRVNIITPNLTEAETLVGFPLHNDSDIIRAAEELLSRGVQAVIIKLGERGVYWDNGYDSGFRESFPVKAVDTVGAGDAFNGALGAALYLGLSFSEAVDWGLAAGALAVTKMGAQASLPTREELLELLACKSL